MAIDIQSHHPADEMFIPGDFPDVHRLDIANRGLAHVYELPQGYEYTAEADIVELAYLQRDHYPPSGSDRQISAIADWIAEITDLKLYDIDYVDVAVRADEELVAFQRLAMKNNVGVLASLVVHEAHRRRGIARTLVAECVSLAEELGVVTLKTEKIEQNHLDKSYADQGFRQFRKPHPRTGVVLLARTSSRNYPGGRVPTAS